MVNTMNSILIRSARIINPARGEDYVGDIAVENGKIVAMGILGSMPGARVINADGLAAFPGLVDLHVHLRDPGFTEKEDIISGCKAAAAGGVTSLLNMPNTKPCADNTEVIAEILQKAESASARVYQAGAITVGRNGVKLCDLQKLKNAGAVAVSDDGNPVKDSKCMEQALIHAKELGLCVAAHCEDKDIAGEGIINEGEVSRELNVKGISSEAENIGTMREISLAKKCGAPIHICHVSTKEAVEAIREAKREGVAVTAETCPQYFCMTEKELLKRDADYRMNPPLRTEEDRLALLEGLRDGTIDAIATDHAPHTTLEKQDFEDAPNGVIGMETSFSAAFTCLVESGAITLPKLIEKMSVIPAKILSIPAGILDVGENADIVLFNPRETWVVNPQTLHGKSKNTPFKGKKLKGKVKYTICRGKVVYEDK